MKIILLYISLFSIFLSVAYSAMTENLNNLALSAEYTSTSTNLSHDKAENSAQSMLSFSSSELPQEKATVLENIVVGRSIGIKSSREQEEIMRQQEALRFKQDQAKSMYGNLNLQNTEIPEIRRSNDPMKTKNNQEAVDFNFLQSYEQKLLNSFEEKLKKLIK